MGREKDRIHHLHAKVWDAENYASYEDHKSKEDELLRNEISKEHAHCAVNCGDIERDVGALQKAKIAPTPKSLSRSGSCSRE